MWRELAISILPNPTFEPGVDESALVEAENALGDSFPNELRSLLLETNGIVAEGLSVVWPLNEIVEQNLDFRTRDIFEDYLPFEGLLFFGDNGYGDQYAFHLRNGLDEIYIWDHENDSRSWAERGLERYFNSAFDDGEDGEPSSS